MLRLAILFWVTLSTVVNATFNFLSIGDWGGAALGGHYITNVYDVAKQMAATATLSKAEFVLNSGDNFYWCGITNTSDYQITTDWVDPYSAESLQIPWYSILGNHEYGYNVQAQIDLANLYPNWVMDDRYYTRRVPVDEASGTYISFIFLDTSPCISGYRSDNPANWDPCMSYYPTCSLVNTNDDFEGPCMFHENIISQSCDDQYTWLQSALSNIPADDWLIIMGHHPIDEVDVLDMTSLIQRHGFSLYINGHSHTLAQYTIDKTGAYITTGAGSLVNTVDQEQEVTQAKVLGKDISPRITGTGNNLTATHSYQTIFNQRIAGFTQHAFSEDFSTLTTNFIAYTGSIIHSFSVNKAGQIV